MTTISIVTICFNNLDDVILTCDSVDQQTIHPEEHWIINGSTEPYIQEWLENHPQPPYRRWAKIINQHIAGNFNRGIEKANSDFIHLLNSGDFYSDHHVLKNVYTFLEANSQVHWISGKLQTKRGGHLVEIGKPFEKSKLYRGMRSVSHPTWFVRKSVYDRIGLYNMDYRIAMDYEMACRIADEPYEFINLTISYFDNTGISSVKYLDGLAEILKAYEIHFGFSVLCRLWQLRLKLLYYVLSSPIGNTLYSIKKKLGLENA